MCRMRSTRVRRRRKFGEVSRTECTGQRNDFELISTAKVETRQESFGNEFPSIYNHCGDGGLKSQDVEKMLNFLRFFFEKQPPTGKFSKFCSKMIHQDTDRRAVFKLWCLPFLWDTVYA